MTDAVATSRSDLRATDGPGPLAGVRVVELGMLLAPGDLEVPIFDTTILHAEEAVRRALEGS